MDRNKKGALLVIMAGSCWGVISIFINYLSQAGLRELQISFLCEVFNLLTLSLIIFFTRRSAFRIAPRDLLLLAVVGLINGVVFNFLYFYTIVHSRASIAAVLLYTAPAFVIILARIFFREAITRRKVLALVLTISGCVLVTGAIGEGYVPPAAAIVTGVLTGLAYALNNILTSAAVRKNEPMTVTLYTFFFSLLFLIPFSGWSSLRHTVAADPKILGAAFLMSLVTGVMAQFFFTIGLDHIESGKAAIYGATEPVVGCLVGIFLFHEESNLLKIIGIIMVVFAIILIGKENSAPEE